MRRLFLRLYGALALVLVGGLLLAAAWDLARRGRLDGAPASFLLDAPPAVQQAFATTEDAEVAAARVAAQLGAEVALHPLDRLPPVPPPERRRLHEGRAVVRPGPPPRVWVGLPERGLWADVRLAGPGPAPWPVIGALSVIGFGVMLALQLRPLDRQLARLAEAARRFGAGDRAARADLPPSSATGELGAAFDGMAERIAALIRSREELLVAVSHELRTPLHRLRFAVELLSATEDAAEREARLLSLQEDFDELDALVGELLAWGRLEASAPPSLEDVPLRPVAERLAAESEPGVQVEVDVPDGLVARAERALLVRAWRNGVQNAARYGSGRIQISAAAQGEQVELRVDDDGPGVPEAERERVFAPFERLDAARSSETGGVGLGLALVARVARAHGGAAALAPSPLGGARLTIRLPRADVR